MFGKRSAGVETQVQQPQPAPAARTPAPRMPEPPHQPAAKPQNGGGNFPPAGLADEPSIDSPPTAPARPAIMEGRRSESFYETKGQIFGALIEAIDLTQLAKLDPLAAREEIRDIVNEIIAIKNVAMSISDQEELLEDICNDVLGYGPLEPLLARDDIADIMVNGSNTVYIEVQGKIQQTGIRFRDNQQLHNICQRIVSQIGRRVDEVKPDLRRAPSGWLARQRDRAAVVDRRTCAHHPQVQERQAHARTARALRHDLADGGAAAAGYRPLPREYADIGRHRLGQDDLAQLSHPLHRQ